tara:strand:- start:197 stop:1027 length:831 start_codon:yes stop_codon:yes gene_type:complete
MIDIKVLDFPILSNCNLRCDNCSSYSNLNVEGVVQSLSQGKKDLVNWKKYINPIRLQILGGEPLLHKELPNFIKIAREIYPDTDLRIYTNGLLLKRHKNLKKVLQENDCMLVISVHSVEEKYKTLLHNNLSEFLDNDMYTTANKSVVSFAKVFETQGIKVELRDMVHHWSRVYKKGIKPFNSDYKKAHEVCMWTHCTQLYKSKLWKCTQTAFFDDLMRRINNHEDWEQYKNMYTPLSHDDPEHIKEKWFSEFLQPEPVCSMCRGNNKEVILRKNVW